MQVRAMEDSDRMSALGLLVRGFPDRSSAYWGAVLDRLFQHRTRHATGPIGHILSTAGKDAGILLTIERPGRGSTAPRTINLSSWYADPEARWMAVRLLQKAMDDTSAAYTDLSASPEARSVNEKLGFRLMSQGSVLVPTMLLAAGRSNHSRLHPVSDRWLATLARDAGSDMAVAVEDHHRLGAIAGILETETGASPVIALPTRSRGLAGARIVLAERRALAAGSAAIGRHLMARGKLFLEYEPLPDETLPKSAIRSPGRASLYVHGATDPARIDHSYSELVFLNPELNEH
jgi:hypothetical protein